LGTDGRSIAIVDHNIFEFPPFSGRAIAAGVDTITVGSADDILIGNSSAGGPPGDAGDDVVKSRDANAIARRDDRDLAEVALNVRLDCPEHSQLRFIDRRGSSSGKTTQTDPCSQHNRAARRNRQGKLRALGPSAAARRAHPASPVPISRRSAETGQQRLRTQCHALRPGS